MAEVFIGQTTNEAWLKAVKHLSESNAAYEQESRGGVTREIMGAFFVVDNPIEKWTTFRRPPINIAFAMAEVVWILGGHNDSAFLNFWNSQLQKFAGSGESYYGAYGHRLRHRFGYDQIERAYQALRNNPESRQIVVQIWDPDSDMPNADGSPRDMDIPCNLLAMLKIRSNKLEWTQIMRSNDIFLGTPHNFIQFMSLQEIIAGWLEVGVGEYRHYSDSLHLYKSAIEKGFSYSQTKVPENRDSLTLPRKEFDRVFSELLDSAYLLTLPQLKREELIAKVTKSPLPEAYKNILIILAAFSARKRKWTDLEEWLPDEISNPLYSYMWQSWISRMNRK